MNTYKINRKIYRFDGKYLNKNSVIKTVGKIFSKRGKYEKSC